MNHETNIDIHVARLVMLLMDFDAFFIWSLSSKSQVNNWLKT